jgi:hypothetical protein
VTIDTAKKVFASGFLGNTGNTEKKFIDYVVKHGSPPRVLKIDPSLLTHRVPAGVDYILFRETERLDSLRKSLRVTEDECDRKELMKSYKPCVWLASFSGSVGECFVYGYDVYFVVTLPIESSYNEYLIPYSGPDTSLKLYTCFSVISNEYISALYFPEEILKKHSGIRQTMSDIPFVVRGEKSHIACFSDAHTGVHAMIRDRAYDNSDIDQLNYDEKAAASRNETKNNSSDIDLDAVYEELNLW